MDFPTHVVTLTGTMPMTWQCAQCGQSGTGPMGVFLSCPGSTPSAGLPAVIGLPAVNVSASAACVAGTKLL